MRSKDIPVFILLALLGLAAYRDCFSILIPADNYGEFYFFEKGFTSGFYESSLSSSPYLTGYPFQYMLWLFFGSSPAGWVTVCLLLHTVNAFLVFLIGKALTGRFLPSGKILPALFASILFLLSPYQTEAVLWGTVSARWLFNALASLASIYGLLLYLQKPSPGRLISIHLLFVLALFSNQTALVLPVVFMALFFLHKKTNRVDPEGPAFFKKILSVNALSILLYFLFNQLITGHWFWHGGTIGAATGDPNYIKTLLKYFAKFFFLYRYLPFGPFDIALREWFSGSALAYGLLSVTALALLLLSWRTVSAKTLSGYLILVLFVCFVVSLLPVLPLDSSFLKNIYPDRYGYPASSFFYMFLSVGLFVLLKNFFIPVVAAYTTLCWFLLAGTIQIWTATNDYCRTLIKNFSPLLKYDHVYVLNEPSYFRGVVAFRMGLPEAVQYPAARTDKARVMVVSGCYQESISDSLLSVSVRGNEVVVKGPDKHTPNFCRAGWPVSYETDEFAVYFDTAGCAYTLLFKKEIPPNSAIVYAVQDQWKIAAINPQ